MSGKVRALLERKTGRVNVDVTPDASGSCDDDLLELEAILAIFGYRCEHLEERRPAQPEGVRERTATPLKVGGQS